MNVSNQNSTESNNQINPSDNIRIIFPPNHNFPLYYNNNKMYDRFLPFLIKSFNEKDTVIDIGANVGDTLAGFVMSNPKPKFICIEPEDDFYSYLTTNVNTIKSAFKNINIRLEKKLVGKFVDNVKLIGEHGTSHSEKVIDHDGIKSSKLDDIVDLTQDKIRLLKVDIDGYDYDAINSAERIINSIHPILFFECETKIDFQLDGYKKTIKNLFNMDYKNFYAFDNFGNYLCKITDVFQLNEMLDYVWRENQQKSTRTFYYFDFAACVNEDCDVVEQSIKEFLGSIC